ncbi:unnamed protein product [Adineta steineri]|uniref:Uncharacterized protein n=1 Tax=Adineta steineri TaxID=433720 RepID=A0A819KQA4_9BILA|nr:unnamed protein product [Adineta steineri]
MEHQNMNMSVVENKGSPIVSRLSRLIEGVTNESMIIAEDLQFSLGPANRITTWLTYLSDVEGSPYFGRKEKCRKNSAIYHVPFQIFRHFSYSTKVGITITNICDDLFDF